MYGDLCGAVRSSYWDQWEIDVLWCYSVLTALIFNKHFVYAQYHKLLCSAVARSTVHVDVMDTYGNNFSYVCSDTDDFPGFIEFIEFQTWGFTSAKIGR